MTTFIHRNEETCELSSADGHNQSDSLWVFDATNFGISVICIECKSHSPQCFLPQPVHLAQSSFLVEAFGTSFILDLELNQ